MKTSDVQMLLQAMQGLGLAGERNRDRRTRNEEFEFRRGVAERGEGRADRKLELTEEQITQAAIERELEKANAEAARTEDTRRWEAGHDLQKQKLDLLKEKNSGQAGAGASPFGQARELIRDYQQNLAEIERAIVDAEMAGDAVRVQELAGEKAAVEAQAQAMWRRAEKDGTAEPLVTVKIPARGDSPAYETKLPLSQAREMGFDLPRPGDEDLDMSLQPLRSALAEARSQRLKKEEQAETRWLGWRRRSAESDAERLSNRERDLEAEIAERSGRGQSGGGVVEVSTREEYEALPAGARFRFNGREGVKR